MIKTDQVNNRSFFVLLVATAALCGALIMVVEVLGSRVIGPFYGVSLFVWTSLITVTLVALAAGYAAGGVLADRKNSPDYLYTIILISGFLVMLIPWLKGPILKLCFPLGLRSGSLLSALLLFGPSLFMLGCVSPYIVRIAAREMASIGRTVGAFYAISTFGSFVGTVLTGFVLIAYLGVNRIFLLVGVLLVALSLVYFIAYRRKWWTFAVMLFAMPLSFTASGGSISKVMPNGTRATKIFEKDSFYGNLKVVDYTYLAVHTRELTIDGLIQGGIDMNNGLSVYEYDYLMQYIPRILRPDGKNCLVIGLGAGIIPNWYEQQGVRVDVVDIDPAVQEIAKEYFGFTVSGDIIISDARYFLADTKRHYDYIILDVFNGDTTPGHLLSCEAIQLLKERLTPDGILAINIIGSLHSENYITASIVRTVQSVFRTADVYPAFDAENGQGWGNMAVIAYNFQAEKPPADAFRSLRIHRSLERTFRPVMGRIFRFPQNVNAIILRDNYNPLDIYDLGLKEKIRKILLESTDWDIMI